MKRVVILAFVVVLVGICAFLFFQSRTPKSTSSKSLVSQMALDSLAKKDASGVDTSHLASGVTPPTNKWFSGIALQSVPKAIFPTPLSFTPTEKSFTVDMPVVQTTEKSILASPSTPITITINDAAYYRITRYDEISVDLTYYTSNNKALAVITIAAGSPYVYYHAIDTTKIETTAPNIQMTSDSTLRAASERSSMYATGFHGATFTQSGSVVAAQVPKDGLVTFYGATSTQTSQVLAETAGSRITGAAVDYIKTGDQFTTTIRLTTDTKKPTTYGLLPHQAHTATPLFAIDTIYGKQQMVRSNEVSFTTPASKTTDALDVKNISATDKQLLITQLRHDINATQMTAEDTYFGGKQLYRSAQLLQLANQLGENDIADTIQQKLHTELTTWLKPNDGRVKKSFYYDTKLKGIVGETASFGSQEFNDHHFHYGYFIYAASILAKYDADFKEQYTPVVNLLVADIANTSNESSFLMRRNFDPYFGHSWASGSSPFNDGNNQESISEAINAWNAVSLWATQSGNTGLKQEADWMASNEFQSAFSYWLQFDTSSTPYDKNYSHKIAPLNWGGKRDYATFFSADPNALLGILLLPMNPSMKQFEKLGSRIPEVIAEAKRNNPAADVQFSDYILMLNSLSNSDGQLEKAKLLPDQFIDDANSRSYLYAWVLSTRK